MEDTDYGKKKECEEKKEKETAEKQVYTQFF